MPSKTSKKKVVAPVEALPQEEVNVVEAFHKGAQIACGHINKQFVNAQGTLEDLACTLPKGHEGDHFAKYKRVVTEYGIVKDEKGVSRQAVTGTHVGEADGWWGDAAGVPASPHVATQEEDFQRLKKSRDRERGVDEALSQKLDSEVRSTFDG